ncbi:MAG: hypothetical protein QNJ90_12850 [Planctomycetota bacterium]|nr:hypothetical protein [Planctomycetota bacterium]
MRSRLFILLTLLLAACVFVPPAVADDLGAAMLHSEGEALLARGDIDGALSRFLAAARAAPGNKVIARDALVLKRVVAQRKALDRPKRHPKWEGIAISLHAFYLKHALHGEAVKLGWRGLKELKNGPAENRLAEALLETGLNAEALKQLTSKVAWTRDQRASIFRGIALLRTGKTKEAAQVAGTIKLPAKADSRLLRDAARLQAVLGQEAATAKLLVLAFERSPVAQLEGLKAEVRAHSDFKPVMGSAVVAKAMKTASKQKTLACSGASDCGSCPSRGGCSGKK